MDQEKIPFYMNEGIILIILGIVSTAFGTIIPVVHYPYNAFAAWIFWIAGLILIIGGCLFFITVRQRRVLKKNEENGGHNAR